MKLKGRRENICSRLGAIEMITNDTVPFYSAITESVCIGIERSRAGDV